MVSLIERGHVSTLSLRAVRRVFRAVDAGFECQVVWRGGDLDRVLDERHAQLVGAVADRLASTGWEARIEATFSEFGERGSIDILGLKRPVALVVEIKTEVTSVEATLRRLDAKRRLAGKIVSDREGWRPTTVGTLLVVLDGSTSRRRIGRHRASFDAALPGRGPAVRRWLRDPVGPMNALVFLSPGNPGGAGTSMPLAHPVQRRK